MKAADLDILLHEGEGVMLEYKDSLGSTNSEQAANLKVIKNWISVWTLKRNKEVTEAELKAIKAVEK